MSINLGAGLKPALDATDTIQKAAVFIIEGNRYCFYFNGWHGPGWYRCGFSWRRNLGWGGEYGWQSWSYGPAERRYGHGGAVRGTIEGPGRNIEGGATIRRGPPVAGPRGGAEIKAGGEAAKVTDKAEVRVAAKAVVRAVVARSDSSHPFSYPSTGKRPLLRPLSLALRLHHVAAFMN